MTPTARRRALGGLLGPVAFVGAWSIGGISASHYSPIDDAISHLAQIGAPTRVWMTAGFVAFGIGVPIYAIELRAALTGWSWIAAGAAGVATLGVAAAPLGRSSSGDVVHGAFATAGYVALALTPLLAVKPLWGMGRSTLARLSIATGTISAISLVATTMPRFNGLFQRVGLTVVDVWIVTTAIELLRGHLDGHLDGHLVGRRSRDDHAKLAP